VLGASVSVEIATHADQDVLVVHGESNAALQRPAEVVGHAE